MGSRYVIEVVHGGLFQARCFVHFGQNYDATIENSQQNTEKKSRIYFEGDACATPKLADQSLVANLSAPICRVIMF